MESIETNNNDEMKPIIRRTWYQWLGASTAHGVPNMGKTNSRIVRFFWIIFFLTASIYCFYSIVTLFVQFYAYNVDINIQIEEKPPVDFPAVNLNLNCET